MCVLVLLHSSGVEEVVAGLNLLASATPVSVDSLVSCPNLHASECV